MAGVDTGDAGGISDPGGTADDAAAREAARVAVELTEAGGGPGQPGPAERRRIARALRAVADRASASARKGAAGTASAARGTASAARRGKDSAARRGAATASAARGTVSAARSGADSAAQAGVATARGASRGVSSGMNWLTSQVLAMGPRLRIRDRAALRAQFPGQSDDEIAQRLVERAARAAAAVGGATGAWAALPALPAFPAEVAAETLAVVGIEVKLVAELHEIYGMGAPGSGTERARAYLASWASRRGVYAVDGGLLLIAGSPLARQLTRRLAARVRRSTFSLAPLFTGAVAGAILNRRETRKLGHQIRDELRQRRRTVTATVVS